MNDTVKFETSVGKLPNDGRGGRPEKYPWDEWVEQLTAGAEAIVLTCKDKSSARTLRGGAEGDLGLFKSDGRKSFGCPEGCGNTYVPYQGLHKEWLLRCVVERLG